MSNDRCRDWAAIAKTSARFLAAVIKHLGGGSFPQVGALLRELESESGEVPGSALTEPLTAAVTEAIEALWRALGLEADRVVNDARQQFERDLKVEQAAWTQAEAATSRTQEHLQAAQISLVGMEKALASEQSAREQTTAALELVLAEPNEGA